MAEVVIYTQPFCSFCSRALQLLNRKGIPFREVNAPRGSQARQEAVARSGGRTTVPQIFIGGVSVGGCDDLFALERAGRLDPLLNS